MECHKQMMQAAYSMHQEERKPFKKNTESKELQVKVTSSCKCSICLHCFGQDLCIFIKTVAEVAPIREWTIMAQSLPFISENKQEKLTLWKQLPFHTLENLCTRTAQSSRGVRSRRVHKIYYFGLLWSILWASTLQLLIFTIFFHLELLLRYCSPFWPNKSL